jgi:hypothetical protein
MIQVLGDISRIKVLITEYQYQLILAIVQKNFKESQEKSPTLEKDDTGKDLTNQRFPLMLFFRNNDKG